MNEPIRPIAEIHSDVTQMPIIPPGIPPSNASAPKWALTQEQIDFLVGTVTTWWPAFKQYWPIIVLIASGFGIGGAFTGRVTAPVQEKVIEKPAPEVKPPVNVNPPGVPDVKTPEVKPSPIIPPSAPTFKVMVYVTDAGLADEIGKLKLPNVSVEPTVFPAGTRYAFGEKKIDFPCMVIMDQAAKVVDVLPFVTRSDVVAAAEKLKAGK